MARSLPGYSSVSDVWFSDVAARYPGTAAVRVPLVIVRDVVERDSPFFITRHSDFLSLYLVQQGQGTHVIDGIHYGIARGDVYVMGKRMSHHILDGESLVLHAVHFLPEVFDSAALDELLKTPGFLSLFTKSLPERSNQASRWLHLSPDAYLLMEAEFAELRAEWLSPSPIAALLVKALFLRLIVHLARIRSEDVEASTRAVLTSRNHGRHSTVAAALRYLDARYAEPLRIEQVAASVFLSPDHFTEVFSAVMGRTPSDYLRHLRIERAKTLLLTSNASISEVAAQCGFGEASYFSRAFRATVDQSPREYRYRSRRAAGGE